MKNSDIAPVDSLVAAIEYEPDGLYMFWRFSAGNNLVDLEVVSYDKPNRCPERFGTRPSAITLLDHNGRMRRFSMRWRSEDPTPEIIREAAGVRIYHVAHSLSHQYPSLGCEGWLRVPDGDLPELEASWKRLWMEG